MSRTILGILVLLILPGCGVLKAKSEPAYMDGIREAVFRYMFADDAGPDDAKVYFIEVEEGKDPSPDLLARFKGHVPPVKPRSACTSSGWGVKDKETGEKGMIYSISAVEINRLPAELSGLTGEQAGGDRPRVILAEYVITHRNGELRVNGEPYPPVPDVAVYVSTFINGLAGHGSQLFLTYRDGKWVVKDERLLWVS